MGVEIQQDMAIIRFQEILKKKTISRKDDSTDWVEFSEFLPLLQKQYPLVFQTLGCKVINDYGILLKWKGKNPELQPVVLMAHYDVVPVEGQNWTYPPFDAEIHDGNIYARGAVDTKCIIGAILEAIEALIKEDFIPERDIYFTSSNCEETGGDTTPKVVEWFKGQGIKPWFVLDEGGAILEKMPMGINNPFAMIGVSEKGLANIKVTTFSKAGHSSTPSENDSTIKLMRVLDKIHKSSFKAEISPALQEMLRCFSKYVSGGMKFVFNNVGSFSGVIKKVMAKNPETSAMIKTTAALTQLEGSDAINVLPERASAGFSVRIAPQDSINSVVEHFKKVVGHEALVTFIDGQEPSLISSHNTKSFNLIKDTVSKVYPGVDSAPYIMNAATDSRHFTEICSEIYRFGGFVFSEEQRASIHSADEFMPMSSYLKGIDFYVELLSSIN